MLHRIIKWTRTASEEDWRMYVIGPGALVGSLIFPFLFLNPAYAGLCTLLKIPAFLVGCLAIVHCSEVRGNNRQGFFSGTFYMGLFMLATDGFITVQAIYQAHGLFQN